MLPVETPFKIYTGLDGKPLDNGLVYFGVANQNPITAPVTVYWDAAGTQPAFQPLPTVNGYIVRAGTPANVFFDGSYSELVRDSKGRQVLYARTSDDFSIATVVLNFISQLATLVGSSLIGFIQAGIGAILRTTQDKLRETVSVKDFGAVGDGVADDTLAIQKAVDSGAGRVVFPDGNYIVSAPVVLRNGVIYQGAGVNMAGGTGGTKITYTGTTDAFKLSNPVNGSTSANVEISGIYFYAASLTADNGILFDTASSVVLVRRCRFYSTGVGIIMDQSELWDVEHNSFLMAGPTATGIWIVNGADKNVGAQTFFSNRLGFRSNEFNGGAGTVAIYDDGGVAHTISDSNFNAGGSHVIATSVNGLMIRGGEWEGSSAQTIILGMIKRKGLAGGKSPSVSIRGTYIYNAANQPVLATVAGAVGQLEFVGNVINTAFGNPLSGLAVGCDDIVAYGNAQTGIGVGDTAINNYITLHGAIADWGAAVTAPSVGNGTINGSYSRRGKVITFQQAITTGSTTTYGAGPYYFPLPIPANTGGFAQIGSAFIKIGGGSVYAGIARVTPDDLNVEVYVQNASPVGPAVPVAFTTGSAIEFQIQYVARDPI